MSLLEIVMLACFGSAWPVSIGKSLRCQTNAGKSVVFLVVVAVGYAAGIVHKAIFSRDAVIALYALNFAMVCVDMALWFRNARLDRARGIGCPDPERGTPEGGAA